MGGIRGERRQTGEPPSRGAARPPGMPPGHDRRRRPPRRHPPCTQGIARPLPQRPAAEHAARPWDRRSAPRARRRPRCRDDHAASLAKNMRPTEVRSALAISTSATVPTRRRPLLDHDHRAVVEVADPLTGLADPARSTSTIDDVTRQQAGPERLAERLQIEHLDAAQGGSPGQVVVGGHQRRVVLVGEGDQLGVDVGVLREGALVGAQRRRRDRGERVEDVESPPAATAPVRSGRCRRCPAVRRARTRDTRTSPRTRPARARSSTRPSIAAEVSTTNSRCVGRSGASMVRLRVPRPGGGEQILGTRREHPGARRSRARSRAGQPAGQPITVGEAARWRGTADDRTDQQTGHQPEGPGEQLRTRGLRPPGRAPGRGRAAPAGRRGRRARSRRRHRARRRGRSAASGFGRWPQSSPGAARPDDEAGGGGRQGDDEANGFDDHRRLTRSLRISTLGRALSRRFIASSSDRSRANRSSMSRISRAFDSMRFSAGEIPLVCWAKVRSRTTSATW